MGLPCARREAQIHSRANRLIEVTTSLSFPEKQLPQASNELYVESITKRRLSSEAYRDALIGCNAITGRAWHRSRSYSAHVNRAGILHSQRQTPMSTTLGVVVVPM